MLDCLRAKTYFAQGRRLGESTSIVAGVLVIFQTIAVTSKNNDTMNFRLCINEGILIFSFKSVGYASAHHFVECRG